MSLDLDVTGTIIDVSGDTATVRVTSDMINEHTSFNKSVFYSYGQKCDGDLDSILEKGMEVNLSYKYVSYQNNPVFVWIGNKPVRVEAVCGFKPVYNQKGYVKYLSVNFAIVECDALGHTVYVSKQVLFVIGKPLFKEDRVTVAPGDTLTFDAIPYERNEWAATYEATCAWMGTGTMDPRIVDRFRLISGSHIRSEIDVCQEYRGTVVAIPNEVIALIDVKLQDTFLNVFLFRSGFPQHCERIQDLVAVGDTLSLKLSFGFIFPGRVQWFVTQARKDCYETDFDESPTLRMADKGDVPVVERVRKEPFEFYSSSKVLFTKPALTGVISGLSNNAARVTFAKLKIFVHRSDVYIDGALSTQEQFEKLVSSGQNVVNFEAVLRRTGNRKGRRSKMTHDATCVWVGKKPTKSVIASAIAPTKRELQNQRERTFSGVVSKLCLPNLALVYVKEEHTVVVLYDSRSKADFCITDVVSLNDDVSFTLEARCAFGKLLCTSQITHVKKPVLGKPMPNEWNLTKKSKNIKFTARFEKSNHPLGPGSPPNSESETQPVKDSNNAWIPFTRLVTIPKLRSRLIHNHGRLIYSEEKGSISLSHRIGFSLDMLKPVIYGLNGNMPIDSKAIKCLHRMVVFFDGEVIGRSDVTIYILVKRMWTLYSDKPAPYRSLTTELEYTGPVTFEPPDSYIGTIKSIPLHNSAIAVVNDVPILVPMESLVTFNKFNYNFICIDEFLREGDEVRMLIQEEVVPGATCFKYFKAIKCGRTSDVSHENDEKTRGMDNVALANIFEKTNVDDTVSWLSVWGLGECYKDGLLVKQNKQYFIKFTSSRQSKKELSLELAYDRFFIDGALIDPNKVYALKGRKVKFHARYSHGQDEGESSTDGYGLSLVCAWIGIEPSHLAILSSRVVTHTNLFHFTPGMWYEVSVSDFPLPTHMLCYKGSCFIIVPLNQIVNNGEFQGVVEIYFTKGSLVMVCVEKKVFEGKIYAESGYARKTPDIIIDVYHLVNADWIQNSWSRIKCFNGQEIEMDFCHLVTYVTEVLQIPIDERYLGALEKNIKKVKRLFVTLYRQQGECHQSSDAKHRVVKMLPQ